MHLAPSSLDISFTLACAAAVFLMQAGFCLLESGLVRTKNSINVAVKNVLDCGIAIGMFALFGFGVMFGASHGGWVGDPGSVSIAADAKTISFFLFQMVFCSTAATIVSGAVAERIRLWVYVVVAFILSGLIYPTFGHWAWGGVLSGTAPGWLGAIGFVDYAGCVVVHVVGGSAALAAAQAIGRRRHLQQRNVTGGHSLTLSILGCFLLWFGWWGFNGGSGLAVDEVLPLVLLNTNLAAVAGGLTAAALTLAARRRVEVSSLINGTLAGLVAITGACHAVVPLAAVVAGVIGSLVCFAAEKIVIRVGIDDAISAFATHGAAGVWGAAVFALFAPIEQLGAGDRLGQLCVQLGGAILAAFISYATVNGALHAIKRFVPIRVRAGEERLGLNMAEHGATSEVVDLLGSMHAHEVGADYSKRLQADSHTEVGQIAKQYNQVLDRVETEMTSHRETNASLEQERLRLRSVLENAGVGIYQVDPSGQFLSANATLLGVLDCPDASRLIDADHDSLPPWHESGGERSEAFRRAFEQGREVRNLESQITSQQGVQRWVLESFVPIRDESGRLVCFLGTVQDVTDRKRAMLAEVEIAEAKSQAKGEFLANMSHEIRTPLNGIIGMLDLMCSIELDDQAGHYASVARSSADTLLSLVNDILDFSKIEAGRLDLEQIEFDLRDTIEQTAEQFAVMAHRKGLDMNCEISKEIGSTYRGDPERLRQVIINLLGNAIKFTESGEINLRVSRQGDKTRFAVQDTGIGMRSETLSMLFEAFTQADASTTRQYGGTGLGLTISSQLVQLMGGAIQVESTEGEGSTFWFEVALPWANSDCLDNDVNRQLASLPSGLRVLVVDDNATNCEILSAQLTMWGLDVSICQQANSAVERMMIAHRLEKRFDLVILDYCMPDLHGEQVARLIRQEPAFSAVPILMLSSNHELLSAPQLAEVGIQIALTKPARQSRLLDAVTTLLHTSLPSNPEPSAPAVIPAPIAPDALLQSNLAPRAPASPASPMPAATVEAGRQGSDPTRPRRADVLVAEDNQINQIVVEQMLSRLGLTSEVVEDGQQALERVKAGVYGMVLMDGHMPVLDGLAATQEIRRWEFETGTQRTRVVALTANVVAGVRQECLDAGMDDYICKPITLETLKAAVAAAQPPRTEAAKTHGRPVAVVDAGAHSGESQVLPVTTAPTVSEHSEPPAVSTALQQDSPASPAGLADSAGWDEETVLPTKPWQSPHRRESPQHAEPSAPSANNQAADAKTADLPAGSSLRGDRLLLDREQLSVTCGGDPGFANQILGIMRDSLPERLREIETANCDGDMARVRSVAHKLKGAAGDSSLVAVYECAATVERHALDRDTDGLSLTLEALRQRVDATHQLLDELLGGAT